MFSARWRKKRIECRWGKMSFHCCKTPLCDLALLHSYYVCGTDVCNTEITAKWRGSSCFHTSECVIRWPCILHISSNTS